ncbi:hypothetical protein ACP70R_019910 [Stipagrostis hirtigluma subsp. patula]
MADEPSDTCSRTDGDRARDSRVNKRKSSRACQYPNKKGGFVITKAWEHFVVCAFAAIAFMVIYVFTEEDEEEVEEGGGEEGEEEEEDGEDEEEDESQEDDEEEGDEEEEEGEEEDGDDRAELLEVTVDCFIAAKNWAECQLGPGNANIEKILCMLRSFFQTVPGYEEAVKAKRRLDFS